MSNMSSLDSTADRRISTISSASYEEVGFDDHTNPWSEAPPTNTYTTTTTTTTTMSSAPPALSRSTTAGTGFSVRDVDVPIVLGVAVVDFNHLIGPTVEFAYPASLQDAIANDEELGRLLPFLALPDGAHLSEEDFTYFHCSYDPPEDRTVITDVPVNRTLFGISCNRQIASADLLRRSSDVTRSMVQKSIVVIASEPVFGPIRDKLGVVTRAFFAQRDFGSTEILEDFYTSLETSLEGKSGESAMYMGTNLRELVHKFRHKTLVLLKMIMLQKRVMLYGYPVEMLCTYQYSLVSLIPGLLMALRDSGSPELDYHSFRSRPTSLRTSDRSSLLRYMGLPLHLFGNDAFFQPYMPLQQMDLLRSASWLVGTTNQIVTQQKDCKYDLLVNIEHTSFDFSDPKMERLVALTAADRKWMDDIVKTVEDSWDTPEGLRPGFRGSDDDLRARFEEYICAVLSSIKYADFLAKGKAQDVTISGVGGDSNPLSPFSEGWISSFRTTPAYHTWEGLTDPVLFDLCEPRHPCDGKVNPVSDIGIRLAEGIHDLRLDEQLAPTREALSSAFAAGSSSLFRAFDGVRTEVSSRIEAERAKRAAAQPGSPSSAPTSEGTSTPPGSGGPVAPQLADIKATLGGIGTGIGSFFGSKMASFQASRTAAPAPVEKKNTGLRPMSLSSSASSGNLSAKLAAAAATRKS